MYPLAISAGAMRKESEPSFLRKESMEISGGLEAARDSVEKMMYGDMCHKLAMLVQRIMEFIPAFEALQPPKSGMQALCGVHWAMDKAKMFLQRTASSSKLYLAITSDSVTSKFEKVKETLDQSLRRLESSVPDNLLGQINGFICDLKAIVLQPDSSDQEAGNEIIALLQKEKESPGFNVSTELDVFSKVVCKLGMRTAKAIMAEKKALRKLLEKTRKEEDKKKELIVLYLLHLLRKYTKIQNLVNADESSIVDTASSCPPSPSERGSEASTSEQDSDFSSELCGFDVHQKRIAGNGGLSCLRISSVPPEEFRCPISLQLMSDPVIICSGQTYERACIEKWFEEGHDTCPKTQQKLTHLNVTPNYCVKALIMSWCERHLMPIPTPPSPPPSSITDYRFALSAPMKPNNRSQSGSTLLPENGVMHSMSAGFDIVGNDESSVIATDESTGESYSGPGEDTLRSDSIQDSACLLSSSSSSLAMQHRSVEEIPFLTKEDAGARIYISESGSMLALVSFLNEAIISGDENAQTTACFALLNAAANSERNKAEIVRAGALPLLLAPLACETPLRVREAAIVLLLSISCLDENKAAIGSSGAVQFLVNHLDGGGSTQGVKDALTALLNLSDFAGNHPCIVRDGAIPKLFNLLCLGDVELVEKCMSIMHSLTTTREGRSAIVDEEGAIPSLVEFLDGGSSKEKELVVSILLTVSINNHEHSQAILREGVIPSLVMLSVNGSPRSKDKALKLLQHFREVRQREVMGNAATNGSAPLQMKSLKEGHEKHEWSLFRRRTFGLFRKSKSFAFYHC